MSVTPQTVDEYIQSFPPETRAILEAVRAVVLREIKGGQERLSYRMPAVFMNGVVVYYAAFKNHLGVFPPAQDAAVRAKVARYAGPKGNLQFPYSEPLPLDLIAHVVRARLASNLAKVSKSRAGPQGKAKTRTTNVSGAA